MFAQLRGNNQGVVKLTGGGMAKAENCKEARLEKETESSALIDGGQTHGMLVLRKGVDICIEKAKKNGIATVGTFNTSTSTGCLGYFAHRIAREGLVAILCSTSPPKVAPHGSSQPLFGTNPLCIGFPATEEEGAVVLDFTTAAIAYYGLLEAKLADKNIPEGIAYNVEGKLTTDPSQVLEGGAIKSFDGSHKGSGLALMVALLPGPLVKASFAGIDTTNWGNFVIAISPSLFLQDVHTFRQQVSHLLQKVRSARKTGKEEVMTPGERGNRVYNEAIKSGHVQIDKGLYEALLKAAQQKNSKL